MSLIPQHYLVGIRQHELQNEARNERWLREARSSTSVPHEKPRHHGHSGGFHHLIPHLGPHRTALHAHH